MSSVLGLGNALVDILSPMEDDALLEVLNIPKGSMQLVDDEGVKLVQTHAGHLFTSKASGGSAANTIHGLANLGISTGFIGKVGDDEFGDFFRSDMEMKNIKPHLLHGKNQTGRAIALISPDSERTFATFLGAAIELSASDLTDTLFDGFSFFHVEGYLVQNKELVEKALQIAKRKGLKTSLDLASFNVVEENLEFLNHLVTSYVDILFANEEEARAFTGKQGMDALAQMAEHTEIAILKLGKKGSMIKRADEVVIVDVIPADSVDTTGAGDLYAAGFLFGLCKQLSLAQCGKIGAITSGHVIEVMGPKMDEKKWDSIHQKISEILP